MIRQKISQAEIELYSDMLEGVGCRPLFLLLVIVDDGDRAIERARATLRSICRQGYPDWQVALIGDELADALRDRLADGRDDVRTLLDRLLNRATDWQTLSGRVIEGFEDFHNQIEVLGLGRIDPLSRLAGSASADARSVFLGMLLAGDELGCDALLELAVTAGMHRDSDFFYTDEQCVNPVTNNFEDFFKPQWSPDLLLSTNYIGRFWCATRELLERTEATLPDLLQLGEYEVVLRCAEQSCGIRHVPAVLCKSVSPRLDSEAGMKRSLMRAMERRGIEGEILTGYRPGTYRLARRITHELVSIIIATCGARGLIKTCIESLRKLTAYRNFEIVCIDNIPSTDHHSKNWLRENADKVIEIDEPFNWSRFNNRGAAAAEGRLLLFLNDDIEIIDPRWLDALIEHAQRPEVGVVGAQLLFPNRTVQHGGMFLARLGHARHAFRHRPHDDPGYFGLALTQRNVTAVTGACLMTRRETFFDLGGFDEVHNIINNDLDYCLKARDRGLLCIFTPYARLVHHEQSSRAGMGDHYDHDAFDRRWWKVFGEPDPYHNPRLSRDIDDIVPEAEPVEVLCVGRPLFAREAVRRILVVKLDYIGDCIGAIPAIRRLRHLFPGARIHLLGGPWSQALWSLVPEVDEFIPFEKALDDDDLGRLRQRLEPYQFDLAIDLRRLGDTRRILHYTGARYVAGFEQNSEFPWLDIAVEWEGDRPGVAKRRHFSDDLLNLVDAIGVECEAGRDLITALPANRPLSASLEWLEGLDRPLVCVHPAAGGEIQRWPPEYFAELIDLLVEREDVHVAIIGGSGEGEIAMRVLRGLRNRSRVSNLVGMLEFSELITLLARSALFVGNNSGPKHLAAGLSVPTVGIHSGNVDPREWGPVGPRAVAVWRRVHCAPCHFSRPEQCDRDLACLKGIRPVDVYPVCKRFLAMRFGADPFPRPRKSGPLGVTLAGDGFGKAAIGQER